MIVAAGWVLPPTAPTAATPGLPIEENIDGGGDLQSEKNKNKPLPRDANLNKGG